MVPIMPAFGYASGVPRPAPLALAILLCAAGCERSPAPFASATRLLGPAAAPAVEAPSAETRLMRVHGDGRPSVVVGVPARLRFRARIPPDGRLAFGLVLRPVEAPIDVSLAVADGARASTAWSERLQGVRGWAERSVDLSAWSGRDVELELRAAGPAGASVAFGQPALLARATPRRPNVLVYVVDCLRADHVGAYGYGRATTPSIDAIARDGVVFEKLSACAGWTKAAVGCLFTSQNPAEHGARGLDGVLDPARPTLAESFAREGYATAAFVANPIVDNVFGFDRGFDRFVQLSREYVGKAVNSVNTDAADLTAALRPFLEENRERRFFAYVHSLDLHYPYKPKAPYDAAFGAANPGDLDRYDGELLGNDHEIGVLVGELKRLGLYDDTLLVVTADHGEEFGEHGYDRHGHSVFETLLHVPFVVKAPAGRGAGRRVAADVSQLDIAPTLLALAGLPAQAGFAGRDLSPALDGTAPAAVPIFAEQIGARDTVYALRTNGRKYIRRLLPQPESLFFDLRRDPAETRDLLPEEGSAAAPFEEALLRFIQAGQRGYQLRLAGGAGHPIEVTIATPARIHEALRLAVRTGETLEVAPDGKRVVFRYLADSEPRHLVLSTDPAGAPLRISIGESGRRVRAEAIDLGDARHPMAVPFEVSAGQLAAQPAALAARSSVAAVLWYVAAPNGTQPISDEAREGLRALGYVQ